jgi:site-specific DNA-methyltransferase (adenine-specific)
MIFDKKLVSIALNQDCMAFMAGCEDDRFDLAVCDIPYGINVGNMQYLKEVRTMAKQKNGSRLNPNQKKKAYKSKDWDLSTPSQEYFDELRRVSRHQIIFGVDYVGWNGLGTGRIKWNKGFAEGVSFSAYERAYCSMIDHEMELDLLWAGMLQAKSLSEPMTQQGDKRLNEKRIHPTHKPILLYKRILSEFAEIGMKVLDTHLGGGSSRIAAWDMGIDFFGCELDPEYFSEHQARFKRHTSQLDLFRV